MGNKEGWFHLFCPGGIACDDEGELYGIMLSYGVINESSSCKVDSNIYQLCSIMVSYGIIKSLFMGHIKGNEHV